MAARRGLHELCSWPVNDLLGRATAVIGLCAALTTGCASATVGTVSTTTGHSVAGHSATSAAPGRNAPGRDAFRVRISLDQQTLPALGRPIPGYVIVDNDTGGPVLVGGPCAGWIQVGLTNQRIPFSPVWSAVACRPDKLRPGRTRQRITVQTTYRACLGTGGRSAGGERLPDCIGTRRDLMPPLPPGRYLTRIAFLGLGHRPNLSAPLVVYLTRTR